MTPDIMELLRKPFPPEQIGKLPRLNCTDCSNTPGKVCSKHKKIRCNECGNWISEKHIHLDYVGHAEVTHRLLEADPSWTWAPMGVDAAGLPALDKNGGLWIKLTVGDVTRPGYGDAQGKNGPNAVKEAIGDALRNAAMRFGVGLDLWAKSDLDAGEATPPQPEPARSETVEYMGIRTPSGSDGLNAPKRESNPVAAAAQADPDTGEVLVNMTKLMLDEIKGADRAKFTQHLEASKHVQIAKVPESQRADVEAMIAEFAAGRPFDESAS